ncbi:AAA family ATPase [Nocardia wallacei]|uniref:AAA family ATPase n=1 Tax=Nocardia wallacei TaxID=480035 RepID=UPI002457BCDB|nr:AAA family ATPase [Nocardia wallacei]
MSNDENRRYDEHAERGLLGAVMANEAAVRAEFLTVAPDDWYTPRARTLAGVITQMMQAGEPVNTDSVYATAMNRKLVPTKLPPDFLFECIQAAVLPVSAALSAERIVHLAASRRLYLATSTTTQRLESSWTTGTDALETFEHIAYLKKSIEEIERGLVTKMQAPRPIGEFLADRPTESASWIVPGLLQRLDRVILTGEEGLGKSQLLGAMGVAIAGGQHPFSGRPLPEDTPPSRVLIIDCENSPAQLADRYTGILGMFDERRRTWGMPPTDWSNLQMAEPRPAGLDLLDSRDAAWVESQISNAAPDVVVFGSLYKAHRTNPNDEQPARQLAWVLDSWRERYDFALLTEAHASKATTVTGGRSMAPAGSSVWLRWPEYGFGLRRSNIDPGHRHVEIADVVAWRGARSTGLWPRRFRRGHLVPWISDDEEYDRMPAAA